MRVLHIALDINPEQGGPPRSITGLCRALADAGEDVSLFVHDPKGASCYDLGRCRLFLGSGRGLKGHWRRDVKRVLDEVRPDIVHLHGVWCLPLHIDEVECRRRGIPYIIAPRGSLDPWSLDQKAWKKKIALALYQRRDLQLASAIHATCDKERDYVRAVGCCEKIVVSPNGVNPPASLPERRVGLDGMRRMLFLSRISPKKGLLELVRAWSAVRRSGWVLEIVGNDSDGYWNVIQGEIDRLGCADSIDRQSMIDDVGKWDAYARADVFVLPTHTENFGIVVVEALYAGVPVITTKGAPWAGLVENNAGWWIDFGEMPLKNAMDSAMDLTDECRRSMGENGRKYAMLKFDWRSIASDLMVEYSNMICR